MPEYNTGMPDSLLADVDALLVTEPVNIRYLSGFAGVSPGEREAYLLVTGSALHLFTNGLYAEQAVALVEKADRKRLSFIEISRDRPLTAALADLCRDSRIGTLGYEDTNLTVAEFAKLRDSLAGVTLIATRDRVETLRMAKRKDELANIKLAATVTDQCFAFVTNRIRPGVSESRLAWDIEGFLRYRGGGLAFDPIVAVNEHSSEPHYSARSNNPIRNRSLVLLDFGAKVNGYCADMTRVVFLGTPNDDWVRAYETVLRANQKAIDLLAGGERNGATLDAAAREVIAEQGLPPYPHSLGHAVGLAIHEAPRLTVKKQETIPAQSCVTVEPGTYVPGAYGIRIEDLVQVEKASVRLLSKSSRKLTIV